MKRSFTTSDQKHEISVIYPSEKVVFGKSEFNDLKKKKDNKIKKEIREFSSCFDLLLNLIRPFALMFLGWIFFSVMLIFFEVIVLDGSYLEVMFFKYLIQGSIDISVYLIESVILFLIVYSLLIYKFYKKTFLYNLLYSLKLQYISRICKSKKKYIITKKGDLKSRILEIPTFNNYLLEYNPSGDYNKYLKRVDIKMIKLTRYKNKNKKIKNKELVGWKAVFKFSKIPKKGKIEIIATYNDINKSGGFNQ